MNLKGSIKKSVIFSLVLFSAAVVAFAQSASGPAQTIDKAKETVVTVNAAAAGGEAKPAATLTTQSLQGTVVIKSSNDDAEEEDYANEDDAAPLAASLKLEKNANGTLTIDAPGEDVRSIVKRVADLYELNIVIPENLSGSTTLKLREVSWKKLFDVMLTPVGYSYIEDNNVILIKSREELSAEPTETRVFLINYASAGELIASITPLVDATNGGRIQVDRRSNALVVTERPSRFNNIKDIVERLDRPTPQVIIESKFIEITDNDAKNLGVNWESLNSYKLTAGPVESNWAKDSQTYNGYAYTESAVFSAPAFNVVLSSLSTLTGSKLISNPTVVALNNTDAMINIGEEYPIPEYSYNQEQGVFEVSGFSYKPIGINLKVNPQINSQGFITMTITPEVSSRSGEVTFGNASGATIPIISTRKTSSTITVKDGYTLAIGGLIEEKNNTTVVKVPLLGDIPVAGNMFKKDATTKDRRNLLIFITARTVAPDGATGKIFDPNAINEMGITESDLPGYKPNAEEQVLLDKIAAKREEAKRAAKVQALRKQAEAADRGDFKDTLGGGRRK